MHLRSITLKGFKSFPDRTRLEFSPGVSVIVGPNGSGKSNVTDAVLWAMGEQSPLAVRGQSMQDVIFAGAHGVQARVGGRGRGGARQRRRRGRPAAVGDLDRAPALPRGRGRVPGQRRALPARRTCSSCCRTPGLGKEMHSVVSQGRVEAIVTSKPRDRRLLIEEAAGLGKHRKRRRRAQLKLDRTQDNLDRALDVEREARTRLKPLKRQAEAAELHERLARQSDEAHWTLARDDARAAAAALAAAEDEAAARARAAAARREAELAEVAARRERAEARAGRPRRRARAAGRPLPRRALGGGADRHAAGGRARGGRRRWRSAPRGAASGRSRRSRPRRRPTPATTAPAARVAALEAELAQLAEDRAVRLARELAELEERRAAAAARRRRGWAGRPRGAAARGARPKRRRRPRAARARASARRRPTRRGARPPARAPSWRGSTSSCAPTPARPAARPRSPTR